MENGAAVDFILAQHNYLSDHNGAGRTLFVRRYGYRKIRFNNVGNNPNQKYWLYDTDSGENRWFYYWGRYNDFWNNYHYGEGHDNGGGFEVPSYNDGPAEITNWLNGDYKNLFSASVKNQIGQTVLQKKSGFISQVSTSVFLLTAKELGIVGRGYYAYAVSHTSADAELALLKTALAGKTFELPVCVDVEDNKLRKLGKQALTDLTAYALATIEQWGFYALLYTGLNFGETRLYMGGAALRKYDVWVAAYHDEKPTPAWPFGLWQYTSKGKIPGVSKGVDLSHAYKDYAAIIAKKGLDRLREG